MGNLFEVDNFVLELCRSVAVVGFVGTLLAPPQVFEKTMIASIILIQALRAFRRAGL